MYIVDIHDTYDCIYKNMRTAVSEVGITPHMFIRLAIINATAVKSTYLDNGMVHYSTDMITIFDIQRLIVDELSWLGYDEITKLITLLNITGSILRDNTQDILLSCNGIFDKSIYLDTDRKIIYVV